MVGGGVATAAYPIDPAMRAALVLEGITLLTTTPWPSKRYASGAYFHTGGDVYAIIAQAIRNNGFTQIAAVTIEHISDPAAGIVVYFCAAT